MNEYAGFKVGDKVEISIVDYAPIKGIITNFGDRKVGGFAEPDTLDVWIDKTAKFDMLYLRRHDQIKKLPKYAAGDLMRRNAKYGKVCTITEVKPNGDYVVCDAPYCEFREEHLLPFDGFRVGDTVWTIKRGKGRIAQSSGSWCSAKKPLQVDFDNGETRYPKLSSLIPTESKYKEAMTVGCDEIKVNDAVLYRGKKWMVENIKTKFCTSVVDDYVLRRSDHMGGYKAVVSRKDISLWNKCIEGISHIPNTSTCGWAIGCKVEPKFKVGDVVFYNGQKWEVVGIKQRADNPCLLPHIKYDIHRQVTPNGGVGACVNESDLRAWKETKITHDDRVERCSMIYSVSDFKSLKHIGTHINNLDIFSQDAGNGKVVVWYGIKGDDL